MHAVKGLEFPIVFMTGMEEGVFHTPARSRAAAKRKLEEERSPLLRSVITRAKDRAPISRMPAADRSFGHTNMNPPSRFLMELPSEGVELRGRIETEERDTWAELDWERARARYEERKQARRDEMLAGLPSAWTRSPDAGAYRHSDRDAVPRRGQGAPPCPRRGMVVSSLARDDDEEVGLSRSPTKGVKEAHGELRQARARVGIFAPGGKLVRPVESRPARRLPVGRTCRRRERGGERVRRVEVRYTSDRADRYRFWYLVACVTRPRPQIEDDTPLGAGHHDRRLLRPRCRGAHRDRDGSSRARAHRRARRSRRRIRGRSARRATWPYPRSAVRARRDLVTQVRPGPAALRTHVVAPGETLFRLPRSTTSLRRRSRPRARVLATCVTRSRRAAHRRPRYGHVARRADRPRMRRGNGERADAPELWSCRHGRDGRPRQRGRSSRRSWWPGAVGRVVFDLRPRPRDTRNEIPKAISVRASEV